MTRINALPLILLAAPLASCASIADLPTERIASARLSAANGIPVGTVQFVASGDRVSLVAAVTGLDEGMHGFHLHQTGKCERPDFKSAGGHLNPTNATHGELSAGGKHFGDMPNLAVSAGGSGQITYDFEADREQVLEWLFDADGTAVMVHAGPDDYKSDPAGDAGARIACGVVSAT